jgi:hypothetical protein
MTDKHCIIIDDEDQDEIVENLKADAKARGIGLVCFQLNPQDDQFHKNVGTDSVPEYVIDIEKIVEKLRTIEYRYSKVNVIACDYRLQDDHVNGFEIIRKLRNQLQYKKSIILYSANLETVINEILLGSLEDRIRRILNLVKAKVPANLEAGVREILSGDLRDQIHRIRNLTRADIMAFTDKDNYRSSIITALEQDPFSLESELDSLLSSYRDWTFRSVFPPLSGKKLSEIIEEIDSGSVNGIAFQKALLENAVAHMIELNNEINE